MIKNYKFTFFKIILFYFVFTSFFTKILIKLLGQENSLVFWLTHWYEPVILLLFLITLLSLLVKKRYKIDKVIILAIITLIFSLLSIIFLSFNISRGIEGFRFTFFPLLLFFVAYFSDLEKEQINKLVKLYLHLGIIVAIWAIFERFLPLKYWEVWGILPPGSGFGWGWFAASEKFYQSASLIGSPNQLASFLLPIFFLILMNHKNNHKIPFLIIIFLTIALTSSRSAYIGLIAGFLIYLYSINKDKYIKYGFTGLFSISVLVFGFLYKTNLDFRLFSTHGGQTGHKYALDISLQEIQNRFHHNTQSFFLGSGIGSAGPIAIKYGDGIISESWYLQLLLEVGLVGLALWLLFIVLNLNELAKRKNSGLFLGLVAISVTAIFLHTWADNPALSLTFFLIIGICLKKESYGTDID